MAESDLSTLLKTLNVIQREGVWRFDTLAGENVSLADFTNPQAMQDIAMLFQEQEGLTLVRKADADTPQLNRWAWLELSVFSDLQAVGFLAKVAAALSEAGVPCNAVAAFHHDHIFVPELKALAAISAIEALRDHS